MEPGAYWQRVAELVGDLYAPYTPQQGVQRFREKLLEAGFSEARALAVPPELMARVVPWAYYITLNGRPYLHISTYARVGNEPGRFTCFDAAFDIHLVNWTAGKWEKARYLMVRLSPERFTALEAGEMTIRDAFLQAEDGQVFSVQPAPGTRLALPSDQLDPQDFG